MPSDASSTTSSAPRPRARARAGSGSSRRPASGIKSAAGRATSAFTHAAQHATHAAASKVCSLSLRGQVHGGREHGRQGEQAGQAGMHIQKDGRLCEAKGHASIRSLGSYWHRRHSRGPGLAWYLHVPHCISGWPHG